MRNSLLEVTPVIPGSLARLPELAANLFFSWHRPTRALFEDLDPELWKQSSGNPRLMMRCVNQCDARAPRRPTRSTSRATSQALETLDAYIRPRRAGRRESAGRVFLRRVRLSRELPDLLRRSGRARRRLLQGGERRARQFRRGRAAVRAGLFHADGRQRRAAARRVPRARSARPAGRTGAHRGGRMGDGARAHRRVAT